jgi:hypothetical protein
MEVIDMIINQRIWSGAKLGAALIGFGIGAGVVFCKTKKALTADNEFEDDDEFDEFINNVDAEEEATEEDTEEEADE